MRLQARHEVREPVAALGDGAVDRRGAAVQPLGDHLPLGAERALAAAPASERRGETARPLLPGT